MNRFAENVIVLYPNDIASQRDCGAICTKFSSLHYAMLPEGFRSRYCRRWQWLFGCSPRSVRDYLLTYTMNAEENFQFDHDVRLPLYSRLRGARNTEPFEIEYPRDPRSGKPKPLAALIVIAVTILVKIALSRYVKRTGLRVKSTSLVAAGTDAGYDAIISASVLASAIFFNITGISLEAWLGLLIALFIHYFPAVIVEKTDGTLFVAREPWGNEEYLQKNHWEEL